MSVYPKGVKGPGNERQGRKREGMNGPKDFKGNSYE